MTANVIADLVGFIAALIGGYVFREELTVSAAFTQEFLGKWWDIGLKWYRHSVARGVRNVLAFELIVTGALFLAWFMIASTSGVSTESGWWLLPFGAAAILAFLPNLVSMLAFVGVGALDLAWFIRRVQAVQAAENTVEALRRSAEERRLNNNSLIYFRARLLRARSALNRLRAQTARQRPGQAQPRSSSLLRLSRLDQLQKGVDDLEAIVATWNERDETAAELADNLHAIVLTHFELRLSVAGQIGVEFEEDVRERSGSRANHVVLPALVAILAPQVAGLLLLLTSVFLVSFNGLNWFTFFALGIMSYLVYLQGRVALQMISAVLVKVLTDGGDVFNRLLNSILIRPGLEVLPGITTTNYDKVVGGDINVPFKAVGEAAKKGTHRMSMVIDRIFGWVLIIPSIYTFGFVTLSGWFVPYITAMHKQAELDEKSFLRNLAKAEIGTKYTGYVIRLIQFLLAMFGIVFEPSLIWNTFAGWANSLIGDGTLSWAMVGLVIVGGVGAWYFMGKHDEAKTKVAKYPLLALTVAFALLAVLPIVGWLATRGGVEIAVPTVPTSTVRAEAPAPDADHDEEDRSPDTIDVLTGAGRAETPTPIPAPAVEPVVPSTATVVVPRARASAPRAEDVCDQIAHAEGLADSFRASLRRRHHCDG